MVLSRGIPHNLGSADDLSRGHPHCLGHRPTVLHSPQRVVFVEAQPVSLTPVPPALPGNPTPSPTHPLETLIIWKQTGGFKCTEVNLCSNEK